MLANILIHKKFGLYKGWFAKNDQIAYHTPIRESRCTALNLRSIERGVVMQWVFLALTIACAGLTFVFKQLAMRQEMAASYIIGAVFLVLWIVFTIRAAGKKKPPTIGPSGSDYKRHQGLKLNWAERINGTRSQIGFTEATTSFQGGKFISWCFLILIVSAMQAILNSIWKRNLFQ